MQAQLTTIRTVADESFVQILQNSLESRWSQTAGLPQLSLAVYDSVDSTMDVARDIVKGGVDRGAAECVAGARSALFSKIHLVLSRAQSAGRGRQSHHWCSERDKGAYLTLALVLPEPSPKVMGLSLAIGVALRRALASFGADVGLKWPNDVMTKVDSGTRLQKVAGVLIELLAIGPLESAVLVGIGVNVSKQAFPKDVPGVSLQELCASCPDYADVVSGVSQRVIEVCTAFFAEDFSVFAAEWNQHSVMTGKTVEFSYDGRLQTGTVLRVAEDGALVVSAGEEICLYGGEVEFSYD